MEIQTFYLRNDKITLEPNGKGALMYVHDHQAAIKELRDALLNYRKLDHATCGEYDGMDHRCTKCRVADEALAATSQK